jgi:hypothetical protein
VNWFWCSGLLVFWSSGLFLSCVLEQVFIEDRKQHAEQGFPHKGVFEREVAELMGNIEMFGDNEDYSGAREQNQRPLLPCALLAGETYTMSICQDRLGTNTHHTSTWT